jgi:hypothetical protein
MLDGFSISRGRKAFFFEKKKQKTFIHYFKWRFAALKPTLPVIDKSFLLLFFKKEHFFLPSRSLP